MSIVCKRCLGNVAVKNSMCGPCYADTKPDYVDVDPPRPALPKPEIDEGVLAHENRMEGVHLYGKAGVALRYGQPPGFDDFPATPPPVPYSTR